ncbi:hypothetical protein DMH02_004390 [Streptomyces sp. WAC 00631]|uniref:hypothetical protein n=1 Tax=Streptomyces sp. WAC 00631 TaxID=2203201 RepID=UPI000F7B5C25|nr:hypothetical protein [Streptomyces sp. WAC 00631]MCC5032510.1 hypothetical protein [Streptomyces sp. WAC 00631]
MNSAHRIETADLSDAELDNVSGGLSPDVSVAAGPASISGSDVLAQVGAVKDQALGTVGQYGHASVSVSL